MRRRRDRRWIAVLLLLLPPCRTGLAGELPPAELVLKLREARIAEAEGRSDEALASLQEVTRDYPRSILPVMALWDYHRRHQLPASEGRKLRELLAHRLTDPESPLPAGTLRYLVENPDASAEDLTLILAAARNRFGEDEPPPRFLEAIGVLQERLGRLPEARETLGRLLEIEPSWELRWHCIALDRRLGRWKDVAALLREQLSEDSFVVYRMQYVEVLGKLGEYEELARQLDLLSEDPDLKLIRILGSFESLLLQAAWDLRDAGQEAGAETIFRRLLQFDPENVEARNAILHLYSTEEERAAHEAALEERWREETDADALAREGANMLAGGDASRAFELLQRAVEELPDSEIAWFNLGLAGFRLERWGDARQAMERAVAVNPTRAEAHLYLGAALQKLERCEDAVPRLELALSMDPGLSQVHYYLHFCYHALGDFEASQKHLRLYNRSRGGSEE